MTDFKPLPPGVEDRAINATPDQQRQIAIVIAEFLRRRFSLSDRAVDRALEALRAGEVGGDAQRDMQNLTDDLDDRGFELNEQYDNDKDPATLEAYSKAFELARAANTITMALETDPQEAMQEVLYEANHATNDPDALTEIINRITS